MAKYHDEATPGGRPHGLVHIAHPLPQSGPEKQKPDRCCATLDLVTLTVRIRRAQPKAAGYPAAFVMTETRFRPSPHVLGGVLALIGLARKELRSQLIAGRGGSTRCDPPNE